MKSVEELGHELDAIKAALGERRLSKSEAEAIEAGVDRLAELVKPARGSKRGLRAIKGLGKEIWESIDVDEYLREERRSWR